MQMAVVALDIVKDVFPLHGTEAHGMIVLDRKPPRRDATPIFGNPPSCRVGLEACGGTHYWARRCPPRHLSARACQLRPWRTSAAASSAAACRPMTRDAWL